MGLKLTLSAAVLAGFLVGCAQEPAKPSKTHIGVEAPPPPVAGPIPPPVQVAPVLPKPEPRPAPETYSVVVNGVAAQELLFALARDARLNIDVHPGIAGTVTLNAVDQTLPQLLERIARQVNMRYELNGPNLTILPDAPFLRAYRVDFVTASRNVKMQSQTSTQFGASTAGGSGGAGGTTGSSGGTGATSNIEVALNNQLWETLVQNVKDIIGESAGAAQAAKPPAGAAAPSATTGVIGNRESGVLYVRATSRQHDRVRQFIDSVMASVRRQVLIEATVAEVQLSNEYQRGIDWQRLRTGALTTGRTAFGTGQSGVEFNQISAGSPANIVTNAFVLGGAVVSQNLNVAIKLLESFGNVRVLSSPKISVLNNQTALLRVTRDIVYFTIKPSQVSIAGGGAATINVQSAFETTPNVAAEGFLMSVLPQINEADTVVLNVRPTIRRQVAVALDPNPALAAAGTANEIPVFETREFDSMLRIQSGQTAVLGGLMQDSVENVEDSIPGLNRIPFFGKLFAQERKVTRKTELVIFLRATVIRDASINGDYGRFRSLLPTENFLRQQGGAEAPAAAQ